VYAKEYIIIVIGRFTMGTASDCCLTAYVYLMNQWFAGNELGLSMSI